MTRTLSEDDIKAITDAVKEHHEKCIFREGFNEDDKHDLKTLLQIYRESTSTIRKGLIGLVFLGALALAVFGAAIQFRG